MTASAIDGCDVPAAPSPEPGRSVPAPLYVVCSPNRQVGKTMLARLLAEHYMADARPVAAFDLFEEAQRRAIEPLILFLIDPSPVAAKAYGLLRRRFAGISLLPVRNLTVAKGLPYCASFPHASRLVVSLEIATLGPAARALVEREKFSFLNLAKQASPYSDMSARTRAELDAWFRRARFQFREIELSLIREQILSALHSDLRLT